MEKNEKKSKGEQQKVRSNYGKYLPGYIFGEAE